MNANARPVYVKIAEELRVRKTGAGTRAPSVRKVASQFGVSPVTASRALQLLRLQDQTSAAVESAAPERWAVCLHVSPGPHQHVAAQLTAEGFRALGEESKLVFDFETLQVRGDATERQMQARVAAAVELGANGIILLPSRVSQEAMRLDEALLKAAATWKIPVVLIERNLRGEDRAITHDVVSFHDLEGGRLLTRHLLERGCKRIAFVTASPTSSHVERVAGYLSALQSAGNKETLVLRHVATDMPGAAYTELVAQLIRWRADGLICYHEHAAIGLILELLRRGKKIPDDVAVADFYSLGWGESFSIGISSYAFPAKTVAARAIDVIRWRLKNPQAPPLRVMVPGELIIRNSTALAKGARR